MNDTEMTTCPICKARVPLVLDPEDMVSCEECGGWFDPESLDVQRDQWLIEHDMEPLFTDEVMAGLMTDRDELRRTCVLRQDDICVVCGHGMYGDAAVHEAIVKRGDLPGDPRAFNPVNCVAIHNGCHENTREVDGKCSRYLIRHYGLKVVVDFILSLNMRQNPGRARVILLAAQIVGVYNPTGQQE